MKKSISEIKNTFNASADHLKISGVYYAIDESMAMQRLKSNPTATFLLVAYPRYGRVGGVSNATYQGAMAVWILEKARTGSINDNGEDEQMDALLSTTERLIDWLEDKAASTACSLPAQIKFDTIEITPEYRTFGGYNGWMLEFII